MGNIVILDENTINKIAAGEVIDRPASVIKELVENSMDAGAGSISVEIRNGGISYIKVTDNGSGIAEDDVAIAFERHATSKIRKADDLDSVSTMGFRGEALASIAAVSHLKLVSRTMSGNSGSSIEIKGGSVIDVKPTGCPVGTAITVRDLFFNTPARFKFLKKDTTEAGYISEIISRLALGNPNISFRLTSGGTTLLHTPGNNDMLSTIFTIYGKETAKEVYKVEYRDERVRINGYVGKPEIARSNRNQQSVFVNRRYVKSKVITSAIDEAYNTFLMKNRFAFAVLNLELNPQFTDVNVHPSKMEVKFSNEQEVFRAVYNAVSGALASQSRIREFNPGNRVENLFKVSSEDSSRPDFKQQTLTLPDRSELRQQNLPFPDKSEFKQQNLPFSDKSELRQQTLPFSDRPDLGGNLKDTAGLLPPNPYQVKTEYAQEPGQSRVYEHEDLSSLFREARFVGQVFSTYVMFQRDDDLVIVDQHAAHERVRYEELKKRFLGKESISQPLLCVISIELTYRELEFLDTEKEFFEGLGFTYERFGGNSVIVRSVPFGTEDGNIREIFLNVLDLALKNGSTNLFRICDEALYTMACKSAVKANMKLDASEVKKLMEDLALLENPYTCPHGRPSVLKLKKTEMEKMFKRIV